MTTKLSTIGKWIGATMATVPAHMRARPSR